MADGAGGSWKEGQERICYIKRGAKIGRSGRHPGVIITVEHCSRKSELSNLVLFIPRLVLAFIIYSNKRR